jgi:hypothetical protein
MPLILFGDFMTLEKYLSILFDDGEYTSYCFLPNGTRIVPVLPPDLRCQFLCINPLNQSGTRRDSEVTVHRNFLIEMDTGTIPEQLKIVQSSGLPFSACVFSGSKSLHFLVSVEGGVKPEEYKQIAAAIMAKVPGCDLSTKNPSRLSRLPTVPRTETKKEQKIVALNHRITRQELDSWLGPLPLLLIAPAADTAFTEISGAVGVYPDTQRFIADGAVTGTFNTELFKAASNLKDLGFNKQVATLILQGMTLRVYNSDLHPQDLKTITSAFGY